MKSRLAWDIIKIPLSKRKNSKYQGMYEAIVSVEDADLAELNWSVHHSSNKKICYAFRHVRDENGNYSKNLGMHQVILERMLGRNLEEGEMPDHIDGDGLNNTRPNLRVGTNAENVRNKRAFKPTKSGYKGVYESNGRYRASIRFDGKTYYLGTYETPEVAHEAYKARAIELHGEFANDGENSLMNTLPSSSFIGKERTKTNRPNKYTGYIGVLPHNSGYGFVAYIRHEKKNHYLGFCKTAEEAYGLRKSAEERIAKGLHPKAK